MRHTAGRAHWADYNTWITKGADEAIIAIIVLKKGWPLCMQSTVTSEHDIVSYRSHVSLFELSCFGGIDKSPPYCSHSQTVAAILSASEMLRDENIYSMK